LGHDPLEDAAARLQAFARQRLRAPGLVVGLSGPGGWAHQFALGVADAASGQPLQTDALLPIASISKAMTAAALLRDLQAGRVDLDAAVHDHLPWLPLPTPYGPIRLRHLLVHTGGIVAGLDASPSPVVERWPLAGPRRAGRPGSATTTPTSPTPCSGWSWSGSPAAATPRPSSGTCWTRAA
jgi:D-alanyl-D-alanine carboxypeptidase